MGIVENIFKLIQEKGLTPASVSKDTGISQALFSQWKSGKQKPSAEKLKILAQYFNISVGYLMNDEKTTVHDPEGNPIVIDRETMDIIKKITQNPNYKIIFTAYPDLTPEDLIQALKVVKALKDLKDE